MIEQDLLRLIEIDKNGRLKFKLQNKQEFVQQKRLGKGAVVLYSDLCLEFLKKQKLTDEKLKELCKKHNVFRSKRISIIINNAK